MVASNKESVVRPQADRAVLEEYVSTVIPVFRSQHKGLVDKIEQSTERRSGDSSQSVSKILRQPCRLRQCNSRHQRQH